MILSTEVLMSIVNGDDYDDVAFASRSAKAPELWIPKQVWSLLNEPLEVTVIVRVGDRRGESYATDPVTGLSI